MFYTLTVFCLFIVGCWNCIYIYNTLILHPLIFLISIDLTLPNIDNQNPLLSKNPNYSETFLKSICQVDTRLLFQTQMLHLKIKIAMVKKFKNDTESTQNQITLDSNTNPTEYTQLKPLQNADSPHCEETKVHLWDFNKNSPQFYY